MSNPDRQAIREWVAAFNHWRSLPILGALTDELVKATERLNRADAKLQEIARQGDDEMIAGGDMAMLLIKKTELEALNSQLESLMALAKKFHEGSVADDYHKVIQLRHCVQDELRNVCADQG